MFVTSMHAFQTDVCRKVITAIFDSHFFFNPRTAGGGGTYVPPSFFADSGKTAT